MNQSSRTKIRLEQHGKEDLRSDLVDAWGSLSGIYAEDEISVGNRPALKYQPPPPVRHPWKGEASFFAIDCETTTAMAPPAASTLPSPSFVSTKASTPLAVSEAVQRITSSFAASKGEEGPGGPSEDEIRGWIAEEVERQWAYRRVISSHESSPHASGVMDNGSLDFEENSLLPDSVLQGLKGLSPLTRRNNSPMKKYSPEHNTNSLGMSAEDNFSALVERLVSSSSSTQQNAVPLYMQNQKPPRCSSPFSSTTRIILEEQL